MTIEEEVLEDGAGVLGLPSKFAKFRPHQSSITTKMAGSIAKGKKFIIAELPTGSGKTMISMAARQILNSKTLYVCTTKSLQDQFIADFPHAALIKGRANYACGQVADKFPDLTADDCPAEKCKLACPYKIAKDNAIHAPLTVMNTAYYLNELQHVGAFKGRQLVVLDEADTLEDALLDQVSVQISEYDIKEIGLGTPELKTKFETWKVWAEEARRLVALKAQDLNREIIASRLSENEDWSTIPVQLIRKKKRLDRLAGKLGFFLKYVDEYWVWERVEGYGKVPGKWVFKPVRVDQFGDIIFTTADAFILMSATILDAYQYMRNVGLSKYADEGLIQTMELGSVFDASRRPVIVKKGVDLTYKNVDENLPKLAATVKEILDAHPNEKGVIHAVTYRIAESLRKSFPGRVLTHTSANRRTVIEDFKRATTPVVLVSPSVDRGEDFPDDICRFIVIVKMPFPYLGDPRVSRRLHSMRDGQRWYTLKTVSKLVQMTGRGMRHEEDRCTSYILDPGFQRLYRENKSLFPQWWRDAVQIGQSTLGMDGGGLSRGTSRTASSSQRRGYRSREKD